MGDPLDVADQELKVQSDVQTGRNSERFGGIKGTWSVLRSKLNADEVAPTIALQLLKETSHERMRFAVIVPVAVTGYTAHLGRWILAKGKGITVDNWVEEVTLSKTASFIFEIEIGRDPVGIYIDAIAGVPASAIHILYQPTNRKPT